MKITKGKRKNSKKARTQNLPNVKRLEIEQHEDTNDHNEIDNNIEVEVSNHVDSHQKPEIVPFLCNLASRECNF